MSATIRSYAFSFFRPLILKKSLGYSQTLSLVLSTPPAIFAVITSMIIARLSDRCRMRSPFYVLQCVMGMVGLAMTGYLKAPGPSLAGQQLQRRSEAGCGGWPANHVWRQRRSCRHLHLSPAGTYRHPAANDECFLLADRSMGQDAPGYVPGMTTVIPVVALAIFVAIGTSLAVRKLNKDADEGKRILEGIEGFRYAW
ncbi:uncharacterized protein Z519_00264 [Cladophialophora bantiana CBS 173.52]|uniref:Major facilitator superfamily (MFS) profile domain-containing protein n=1 Tax=Cladophialophora bantiana (strain ATCC 10958 / CBS 173.52 / CDC B-1940 / NIH 8579) TaxID=1442370 RepID=A0A0D2HYR9_CLAB1|nr:uncharacterized protein Z519_00264 [Cladophialophora bantiana CBS 173.52]KIW98603.1 hypothetical protein Z519_00264 [Cladophialophora bantiana CBS 173.52]